jgi:hypothetical protein
MVEYKNNINIYLEDVKNELTAEIKEAGLKTGEEIEKYISNYVKEVFTYYNHIRDKEIIEYAERNLNFFNINEFVDKATLSFWFKEGIYTFLHNTAKVCLTEILLSSYDLDEVE